MSLFVLLLSLLLVPSVALGAGIPGSGDSGMVKDYYVKQIGTRDGLSQPSVTAVLTDSDGIIWIGTRYRLNRYVNSALVTYDDSRLAGTQVRMLYEDSTRRLWVSTEAGLSSYIPETDSFELFYTGVIYCAAEYDGKLFFAGGKEMLVLDLTSGEMSVAPMNTTYAIACIPSGDNTLIVVDRSSGIYSFDISTLRSEKVVIPELDGENILSVCRTDDGIWLGVYFKGLYRIDPSGNILQKVLASDYPQIRLEIICDIKEIGPDLWLATDGSGICLLREGRPVTIGSITEYRDFGTLPSAIICLFQDSYSNIWVGSVRDGLVGIKPTSIRNYTELGSGPEVPGAKVILSMCHDDDCLWIGTDGDGVFRYDPDKGAFSQLPLTKGTIISTICPCGNGLLASVYCKGVMMIDKESGRMTPVTIVDEATNEQEITSGYNQYLFNLPDGRVVISGEGNWIFDPADGSFTGFASDFGAGISQLKPFWLNQDKSMVFAYSHSELFRMDLVRNRVSVLYTPQNCGRINTAAFLSDRIYVGTDIGLFSYDGRTGNWEDLSPGLFTRVTRMCRRSAHEIWIVADNILYSLNTVSGRFDIYDEAEGFIASEVSTSDMKDGTFFFGGTYGLTVVPASISKTVSEDPTLSLSHVSVDGRDVLLRRTDRLRLPIRMNSLRIAFNLSGGDPFRRTLLRYSISGPGEISEETYETVFSLPKMQAGDYTVSASFLRTDGRWSENVEYLKLTIPEIIWKRDWFISFLLILLSGTAFLIVTRTRSRADEKLKTAISQHKKDEDKRRSRFVKDIAAEIGSPVSEIISSAHQILSNEEGLSDKARGKLERICSRSEMIEDSINAAMERTVSPENENNMLAKLNQVIDYNLANPSLDVGMLVKEMAMSRSILYDKVKVLTGMGVNEYIQKRKLMQAHKYLVETDKSIAEISDLLGFSSPKYFSVVFKNAYNVSPRDFKKRISK